MDGAMEAIRDFVKGLTTEEEEQPAPKPQRPSSSKVTLHVYDFLEQGLNGMLRQVGTGGFHCAVEVHGKEWSFRRTLLGTGIYWIPPKSCTAHKYRESVPMGKINLSEDKFLQLIHKLKKEWPGKDYDILRRNCCVFSNELCKKLGVGPIPDWITNLAGVGADLRSVVRRPLRQMEEAVFGEETQPGERPASAAAGTPSHSQQGRSSSTPVVVGRPPTAGQGRPSTRRDGYEKLEHSGRPKTSQSLRQLFKQYAPSALLFMLFLCLCALAGAAGAGRLPRPSLPWTSRGQSLRGSTKPVVLPAPPVEVAPRSTDAGPPPQFDCDWGFDTWVVSWSLKQSAWCCNHVGRGCRGSNATSFSCKANFPETFEDWSPYELDWCCLHRHIGCDQIARVGGDSFDSGLGGDNASSAPDVSHSKTKGTSPSTDKGAGANAGAGLAAAAGSGGPGGNATSANASSSGLEDGGGGRGTDSALEDPLTIDDPTALLPPPLIEPMAKVHAELAYPSEDGAERSGFELEDGEAVGSEPDAGRGERRAKHGLYASEDKSDSGRGRGEAEGADASDDEPGAEAVVS